MKKTYFAFLAIVLTLNIPTQLNAAEASHFYIGINASNLTFDIENTSSTFGSNSSAALVLGYDINNIVAVEASYISPGIFSRTGGSDEDISYGASLFARANLRFERTTLFFLGGATKLGVTNASYDDTGLAYGMGIDFYGLKNTALTLKYANFFDSETTTGNNAVKLDGISLGFTHYFDTPRFSNRY